MPNRKLIVTENALVRLANTLLSSKLKGNDQQVYNTIVQKYPEVQQAWDDLDASIAKSVKLRYRLLKKHGLDTSKEEDFAKRLNISLD